MIMINTSVLGGASSIHKRSSRTPTCSPRKPIRLGVTSKETCSLRHEGLEASSANLQRSRRYDEEAKGVGTKIYPDNEGNLALRSPPNVPFRLDRSFSNSLDFMTWRGYSAASSLKHCIRTLPVCTRHDKSKRLWRCFCGSTKGAQKWEWTVERGTRSYGRLTLIRNYKPTSQGELKTETGPVTLRMFFFSVGK